MVIEILMLGACLFCACCFVAMVKLAAGIKENRNRAEAAAARSEAAVVRAEIAVRQAKEARKKAEDALAIVKEFSTGIEFRAH